MSCNDKDYCTNWFDTKISCCCKLHDILYSIEDFDRKESDKRLRNCIKDKTNIFYAYIIYSGVRIFGGYFYKKAQNKNK